MDQTNQENIRMLGEKETYQYLEILTTDTKEWWNKDNK